MSSFNAATAVEALDYDFSKYIEGDEGVGIIPEPTTDQMEAYFEGVRALAKQVRANQGGLLEARDKVVAGTISDDEMEQVLGSMDEISIKKYQQQMCDLMGALCSNSPSSETLMKLPYRILQAFMGWMQGNVRPESTAAGTNR